MYSPDSSVDDRYFYNPMNSLSESESDQTLQPKQSLICEQPAILAKRTDSFVDRSQQSMDKKVGIKPDSAENYKEIKLPDQSFNKQQPQQTQSQFKLPPQASQYNKSQKVCEQLPMKPTAVGSGQNDSVTTSERKRPRIFDPINTEDKINSSSFLKELNKMVGEDAVKKHIETKQIASAEDLIIQKQLFLSTNFTEKNIQTYIDKAKQQVERFDEYEEQISSLSNLQERLSQLAPCCTSQRASLLDQASEDKRISIAKEQFKELHAEIQRLEAIDRGENDQNPNNLILEIQKDMEVKLKLQFAIENLTKLKPQLNILKNNRNFQIEFQAYLELMKQSQKLESEKMKPQFESLKVILRKWSQKIFQQIA